MPLQKQRSSWRRTAAFVCVALGSVAVPLGRLSSIFAELDRLVGHVDVSFLPPIPSYSDGDALRPCRAVQGGHAITRILRGEQDHPERNCSRDEGGGPAGLRFRPGTLQMSSAESLQYCYVNATRYRHHGGRYGDVQRVALSDRHRFAYILVPKSASSTSRYYMTHYFNGTELMVKHTVLMDDYLSLISFVREPLNRFYSSYHEAHWRKLEWNPNFEGPIDPRYAYIYDNMTKETWSTCYTRKARERNGQGCEDADAVQLRSFERYVQDYDGIKPFDVHLMLQTMCFTDGSGNVLPMATLYDAADAEAGWRDVATRVGASAFLTKESPRRVYERKGRLFNASLVSASAQRKICQLMALDYCCLNFELPEACRGAMVGGEEDSVVCTIERNEENETKIHHWTD